MRWIKPSGKWAVDDPFTKQFCSDSETSSLLSDSVSSEESDDECDPESESSSILKSESSDSDSIVKGNNSTVGVGLTLLLLGSRATKVNTKV